MTNGIRFIYHYRDSGNYKAWGSVGSTNPYELSVEGIEIKHPADSVAEIRVNHLPS